MNVVFLTPLVLISLLALPILWWLLRATPPSPKRVRFPGVQLLLGLKDAEQTPDKTPIWLLLLRMLAIAAAILAFAEPVVNAEDKDTNSTPLLVVMDGGWASAQDWQARVTEVERVLMLAANNGRPTVFLSLAKPLPSGNVMPFQDANNWMATLGGLTPQAWSPLRQKMVDWLAAAPEKFDTVWLTDGLAQDANLAAALRAHGALEIVGFERPLLALREVQLQDGVLSVDVISVEDSLDRTINVIAYGFAPNGIEMALANETIRLAADEREVKVVFDMPLELRNRVTRVAIEGAAHAGAVTLLDDSSRRRKVALVRATMFEGPQLTDPMHFLRKALQPTTTLIEGEVAEVMKTSADVIVMSDEAQLSILSARQLLEWVERGGLLLRFAGPQMAAGVEQSQAEDPLLPVQLRVGGRNLGGAMSWTTPKRLQEFTSDSPFSGLRIPDEITVSQQVVAQPGPDLADKVLASLEDGTPLVTARSVGDGRIVLFHITANAEWSSLPLSGLFVQMLERLAISAGGIEDATVLEGRSWTPIALLDGFGQLVSTTMLAPVQGTQLAASVGPDVPAGMFRAGDVTVAKNVLDGEATLERLGGDIRYIGTTAEVSLMPWLLLAALGLLGLDIIATLWVTGRLSNLRAGHVIAIAISLGVLAGTEADAGDELVLYAANETVLAYIITGDSEVDQTSDAALRGLGAILHDRTAIEPADPVGVDPETDALALFPLLYWPVTATQTPLTEQAFESLNRYMRNGGMVLFDTQDAHLGGGLGTETPNGQMLRLIAESLDIPPLVPVPEGHVLTKAFYLLDDFPGRWDRTDVWVQVPNGGVDANDGVTPVIIGANDWAGAWAINVSGSAMFPVGRGVAGTRQREMARRFGVNLVMYVMTGNYKSDQVHVPELLERLGE